jgi:glycosyltransferase involved in cell wall biosynthesis
MRLISVVTACFNEEANVRELYEQVREVFRGLGRYRYEHIFIDNASIDGTVRVLREIAAADRNVKVIVNTRNFGHIRSPYHALLQARGDAVIGMAADLQDPPSLIPQFLERWESGFKVALGVNRGGQERWPMSWVRRKYYDLLARVTTVEVVKNSTGFGLYDREVIEIIRGMNELYPYFRGLLAEVGFPVAQVPFDKPLRRHGVSKNNLLTLFDLAMLGMTTHSKAPLRLATLAGFALSALSFMVALLYLVAKLVFWYRYPAGVAPILIGLFATFSVQLFFIGLLGEYLGAIHRQTLRRPVVVERERINFEEPSPPAARSLPEA